jgi:predicted transcriptional regulator
MSDVATVPQSGIAETQVDLFARTPAELADVANQEYEASYAAASTALEHALRSGEALLAARDKVPTGGWLSWLSENFTGAQATAQQFMRLAYHRDAIQPGLTVKHAYRSIAGLPASDGAARRGRKGLPDDGILKDAARMRREGMTYEAIGEVFGVSDSAVQMWLNPSRRDKARAKKRRDYQQRRAAQAEIARRRRDAAVKRIGGGTAEVYSFLRKASQQAEALRIGNEGSELSGALRKAINHLYAAEDEIVRALGVE